MRIIRLVSRHLNGRIRRKRVELFSLPQFETHVAGRKESVSCLVCSAEVIEERMEMQI